MADRYRINRNKFTANRKTRKRRFIKMKNRIRTGNGIYYTHHLEDETTLEFRTWIDVYFLSNLHKGKYYSAALCTPDCIAFDKVQEAAFKEVDKVLPYPEDGPDDFDNFERIPKKHPKDPDLRRWIPSEITNKRHELMVKFEETFNEKEYLITPEIKLDPSYYAPAIGCIAIVNTPSLTPKSIIEFIEFFRKVAEPHIVYGKNPAVVWKGEEVKRVPAEFNRRYQEYRDAQSTSD